MHNDESLSYQCLDDVIVAHESYLNEILDRALLAPQHETLNMQVSDKRCTLSSHTFVVNYNSIL